MIDENFLKILARPLIKLEMCFGRAGMGMVQTEEQELKVSVP